METKIMKKNGRGQKNLNTRSSENFFNRKIVITTLFLFVIGLVSVIFNSCKKEDEYSYIEDYYMQPSTLTLKVGENEELWIQSSSNFMPSGDGTSWNWTSSNNSVATIADGCCLNDKYVYAVGKGTATITCTISSANGNILKTVSCEVTVSDDRIPGLGNTSGNLTGSPFTLPTGIELTGDITGLSGNYNNYWNQTTGNYYGSGRGFVDLLLKLHNTRSTSETVTFPAATILISKTGTCQNGVLIQKVTVTIPANSNYLLNLSFYCGNKNKHAAGSSDVYLLGVVSNASRLLDLCNRVMNKKINIEKFSRTSTSDYSTFINLSGILQNIVWDVTDGNGLTQNDITSINSLPNN